MILNSIDNTVMKIELLQLKVNKIRNIVNSAKIWTVKLLQKGCIFNL